MARFAKAGWRSGIQTHFTLGVRSLPLGWVEPESRPQVPESANPESGSRTQVPESGDPIGSRSE